MAYRQVKGFTASKGGSQNNMCLKNTREGFGIPAKFDNAWEAWENTEQHKTRVLPQGVDVPVFFWYKNNFNGHIGVRMKNGKFWTDGREFNSIEEYEANHQPDFVGWGESINEVRVLEYVPDPVAPAPGGNVVPKKIYLKPTVSAYAFYREGTPLPVKRVNRAGELNPKKWNGITYPVIRQLAANTYLVKSPSLGEIVIWAGDNDSVKKY